MVKLPMKLTQYQGVVFERVSIDIMGPIGNVSADGYKYILMIQCQLSKFLVAVPLPRLLRPLLIVLSVALELPGS